MSGSVPRSVTGEIVTGSDGKQYYVIGKDRIRITEHFPASGKPLDELIADLIIQKIKEKATKTA